MFNGITCETTSDIPFKTGQFIRTFPSGMPEIHYLWLILLEDYLVPSLRVNEQKYTSRFKKME